MPCDRLLTISITEVSGPSIEIYRTLRIRVM